MRIKEILDYDDHKDIFDVLKSSEIPQFDKLYDVMKDISNDFSIPTEWMSYEIIQEMKIEFKKLYPSIKNSFPDNDNRWNIKLQQLKNYFGI